MGWSFQISKRHLTQNDTMVFSIKCYHLIFHLFWSRLFSHSYTIDRIISTYSIQNPVTTIYLPDSLKEVRYLYCYTLFLLPTSASLSRAQLADDTNTYLQTSKSQRRRFRCKKGIKHIHSTREISLYVRGNRDFFRHIPTSEIGYLN